MELKAPRNLQDLLDDDVMEKVGDNCVLEVSLEHPGIEEDTYCNYSFFTGDVKCASEQAPMPGEKPKYLILRAIDRDGILLLRNEVLPRCIKMGYEFGTGLGTAEQKCSIVLKKLEAYYGSHQPVLLVTKERVEIQAHDWGAALYPSAVEAIERICSYES